MEFTLAQFRVATAATAANAATYYDSAREACERFSILTVAQLSAFFATMKVETNCLAQMEEDLYYRDPERLCLLYRRVFDTNKNGKPDFDEITAARAYCRMPKELSQKLYSGYHGRGGMMLTWERNYAMHGLKLGEDYLGDPDLLKTPKHAMLSAASYWDSANCNPVAHDMDEVTRRVNGPARLHLAERKAQQIIAYKALA